MEQIFAQFMHIYFWVFSTLTSIGALDLTLNYEVYAEHRKKLKESPFKISIIVTIGITLFIMSFKY